ncbi:MAG: AMP-binding protein [Ardenticatenaceae bacterium]|nr:AMP-binding protein [Ardenticatenaceae bacterium]
MTLNIASHFEAQADQNPDQIFLQADHQTLTYKKIWTAARRLATSLKSLGVHPGDRVIILQANDGTSTISLLGTLFLGAVAVPLQADSSADDLTQVLIQTRAVALITNHDHWHRMWESVRKVRSCQIQIVHGAIASDLKWDSVWRWEDLVVFSEEKIDLFRTMPEDNALFIYYRDESNRLRGIPLTHLNLHYVATQLSNQQWQIQEGDRLLADPSSNFTFSQLLFFVGAAAGATVICLDQPTPGDVFHAIRHQNIQLAIINNALARYCLRHSPSGDFSHVHISILGAERIPQQMISELKTRFRFKLSTGFTLYNTLPLTLTAADAPNEELRSVGRPLFGTEIEIRDAERQRSNAYISGYIYARGPQLNGDSELSFLEHSRVPDWQNTGLIGYLDEQGLLFLTHEKPENLKTGPLSTPKSNRPVGFASASNITSPVYGR